MKNEIALNYFQLHELFWLSRRYLVAILIQRKYIFRLGSYKENTLRVNTIYFVREESIIVSLHSSDNALIARNILSLFLISVIKCSLL
jgi:hypothetical protein